MRGTAIAPCRRASARELAIACASRAPRFELCGKPLADEAAPTPSSNASSFRFGAGAGAGLRGAAGVARWAGAAASRAGAVRRLSRLAAGCAPGWPGCNPVRGVCGLAAVPGCGAHAPGCCGVGRCAAGCGCGAPPGCCLVRARLCRLRAPGCCWRRCAVRGCCALSGRLLRPAALAVRCARLRLTRTVAF